MSYDNKMTVLLIAISVLAILALVALFILGLVDYFQSYVDYIDICGPKIKFSIFHSAYNANPERWDIDDDDYIACDMHDSRQLFHFSYIDTWRYRWWRRRMEKKKYSDIDNEIISSMLEIVKQDIDAFKNTKEYHK